MASPTECAHCGARNAIVAPHPALRLVVYGAWASLAVSLIGCAMCGLGFALGFLPPYFAVMVCLIGGLHQVAFDDPYCSDCGKAQLERA
jgi:hypothetical protein